MTLREGDFRERLIARRQLSSKPKEHANTVSIQDRQPHKQHAKPVRQPLPITVRNLEQRTLKALLDFYERKANRG